MQAEQTVPDWLPPERRAAVCFTIDDVHPSTSADAYEAGGDLGRGALGRVERLLTAHPRLRVTLFVTPDWRPRGLVRRRSLLTHLPWIRDRIYWCTLQPPAHLRVDRHPDFVRYLGELPRTDVAVHGLHHIHRGPRLAVEFQRQSQAECRAAVQQALDIFARAGLDHAFGFQPPAWNLPDDLRSALDGLGFRFVSSARDIETPIAPDARTAMSGLHGVSLIHPQRLPDSRLVHITSNFQASSPATRADRIIDAGGLLCIKAHIFKSGGGHTMVDGLDDLYCNYLDLLFTSLETRYGDSLWWTSMAEVANRMTDAC